MGKKLSLKPLKDRDAVMLTEGRETTASGIVIGDAAVLPDRLVVHGPAKVGGGPLSSTGIERDAVFGIMTDEQRRTQRSYIERALSRRRKIRRPVRRERAKLPSTLAWS